MKKTLKFFLSGVIAVIAMLSIFMIMSFADNTSGLFTYEILDDGTASITGLSDTSYSGELVIPSEIDGYTVTEIANYAFSGNKNITGVTFPDTITRIGGLSFGYTAITEVTIPESVTTIGGAAFAKTYITEIVIPDTVTSLGQGVFFECESLEYAKIGSGVTFIQMYAFWGCENLKEITLSEGLVYIDNFAFLKCLSLESITLPSTVKYLGMYVFDSCISLTNVELNEGLIAIGGGAFGWCPITSINLPSTLRFIGYYIPLSYWCDTEEYLEERDDCIEHCEEYGYDYYFDDTDGIFYYTDTLYSYGSFAYCPYLETITIADGNEYFLVDSNGCLYSKDMKVLYSVPASAEGQLVLPEGLEAVASYAFSNCCKLTSIVVPSSYKTYAIEGECFDAYESMDDDYEFIIYYCGTEEEWNQICTKSSVTKRVVFDYEYPVIEEEEEEEVEEDTTDYSSTITAIVEFLQSIVTFFKNIFSSLFSLLGA